MNAKSKPKPKRQEPLKLLLDQYHLDIYIRPTRRMTYNDRRRLKRLMRRYLSLLAMAITGELDNKIQVEVGQ